MDSLGDLVSAYEVLDVGETEGSAAPVGPPADDGYEVLLEVTSEASPLEPAEAAPAAPGGVYEYADLDAAAPEADGGGPEEEGAPAPTFVSTADVTGTPDELFTQPFQRILDQPTIWPKQVEHRLQAINLKSDEFVAATTPVVSTIVSERTKATEERSIRPIDAGGVAGGVKYLHDGVFFKFAVDENNLFGDDTWSAKGAGLELKANNCVVAANIANVHQALCCTVDFGGMRVAASSVLPITGSSSLVMGSADAGKTVFGTTDIPDDLVQAAMVKLASTLNLADHVVTGKHVHFAGDVEGHMGTDGRFYLLDLQRLTPPETPHLFIRARSVPVDVSKPAVFLPDLAALGSRPGASVKSVWAPAMDAIRGVLGVESIKMAPCMYRRAWVVAPRDATGAPLNRRLSALSGRAVHGDAVLLTLFGTGTEVLYELLRPELVKTHPTTLSADCFTRWGMVDALEHNAKCKAASLRLHGTILPAFAAELGTQPAFPFDADKLVSTLHDRGANLRHLGRLRSLIGTGPWLQALLLEMVARAFRRRVYSRWRKLPEATPAALHTVLARELNMLMGYDGTRSAFFWNIAIKELVVVHYRYGLAASELSWDRDLRASLSADHMPTLLARATSLLFVQLSCPLEALAGRPVATNDIAAVMPRVKRMRIPPASVSSLCDPTALASAVANLEERLTRRQSLFPESHTFVTLAMLDLAEVYLVTPKLYATQAFDLLERVSTVYREVHGEDSEKYLLHRKHTGELMVLRSPPHKAEGTAILEGLIPMFEKRFGVKHEETNALIAGVANAISPTDQGRALELLRRVLEVAKALYHPRHHQVAIRQVGVANLLSNVDEQLALLMDAHAMYKEAEASEGTSFASYLASVENLIGRGLLVKNDLAGAQPWFVDAKRNFAKSIGVSTVSYFQVLINEAQMHKAMGNVSEALALTDQAIAGLDQVFSGDSELLSAALNNKAGMLMALGAAYFQEAKAVMERAIKMREQVYGPQHRLTLESVLSLGAIYQHLGQDGQACVCFKKALLPLKRQLGMGAPVVQVGGRQLQQSTMILHQTVATEYNRFQQEGMAMQAAGNTAGALEAMKKAEAVMPADETTQFNLACLYSALSRTSTTPDVELGQAFRHLQLAVDFGFHHAEHAAADDDLAPLKEADPVTFQQVIDEMAALLEEAKEGMKVQQAAMQAAMAQQSGGGGGGDVPLGVQQAMGGGGGGGDMQAALQAMLAQAMGGAAGGHVPVAAPGQAAPVGFNVVDPVAAAAATATAPATAPASAATGVQAAPPAAPTGSVEEMMAAVMRAAQEARNLK